MTKIIMHGCNGRMGQVITELVKLEEDAHIVAGIDLHQSKQNDYPVYKSLEECDATADVIIDFSTPKVLDNILNYAITRQIPVVLCTTGFTPEDNKKIEEASSKVAILKSANMSLGVNTLLSLVQIAAKILADAQFDIEIVEKHHNQKVDAPSGTALALADAMNEVLDNEYHYVYDRSVVDEKRNPKEIGISAVRGGNIVGEHEVIFAGFDEVVEIKHTAYSRSIFAKGAIKAAKFLAGKSPKMYDMRDVVLQGIPKTM